MSISKQNLIIEACFDNLVTAPYLIHQEQLELTQSIIDALGDYPRPKEKGDNAETAPNILGAYLCISTARNTLKLALLNYAIIGDAFACAYGCFETALTLLTDNN